MLLNPRKTYRYVKLANGETLVPPSNFKITLISGEINHVNGTQSRLHVTKTGSGNEFIWQRIVDSATATEKYALIPITLETNGKAQRYPFVIDKNFSVVFFGFEVWLLVEEEHL